MSFVNNPESYANYYQMVVGYLDSSAAQANAIYSSVGPNPTLLGETPKLRAADSMLRATRLAVNSVLGTLNGIPVIFDNTATRTTEAGVVDACNGFSRERGGWEMAVNTQQLAAVSGSVRMATVFGPGELTASYQRALEHSYVFNVPRLSRSNGPVRTRPLSGNIQLPSSLNSTVKKLF